MSTGFGKWTAVVAIAAVAGLLGASPAWAHCDTLAGPVVIDAQKALELGDVTPVLKWIHAEDEAEIRSLFDKTLELREKGEDVRELADRSFFENLVRVHRASEGAPYTGLKPADTPLEPGVEAAEDALDRESDRALVDALKAELEASLNKRYQRTLEASKHKDDSVEAGREYVEAYVDYVHFVEHLHAILGDGHGHGHGEATASADAPAPKPAAVHSH